MIHIVGTNHELQHTAKPFRAAADTANKAREELKSYLRQLAGEIRPAVVAEEFSQEVLSIMSANSNVKAVADALGIAHRFCDPDIQERTRIGLPGYGTEDCDPSERGRFDAIREAYWLEQLSDVLDKTILFVCGADHVSSFNGLLRGKDIAVEVREEYFGKEIYACHEKERGTCL